MKSVIFLVENVSNCICLGIVGEIAEDGNGHYIWTHKKLDVGYNGKQIVDVNLTSDGKVKLEPSAKLQFSYEVRLQLLAYTFIDIFLLAF